MDECVRGYLMKTATLKRSTINKIISEEVNRAINEIEGTSPTAQDLKEKAQKALGLLETEYADLHQDLAAHLTTQGVSNQSLIELIKAFTNYIEALGDVVESL